MSNANKPDDLPFLSRWSKQKIAAGEATNEFPNVPEVSSETNEKASIDAHFGVKSTENPHPEPISPIHESNEAPAPTELPPIDSLTHESDFTGFMGKDVEPGLRNQAMKKLFTDPHYQFEQMDKLDIYLDDYSKPDPIPPDMLRRMYQSKSLFLFEDEEKEAAVKEAADRMAADATSDDKNAVSADQLAEVDSQDLPAVASETAELAASKNVVQNASLQADAEPLTMKPATR